MKSIRSFTYSKWDEWRWALAAAAGAGLVWWLCFRHPVFWVWSGMGEPNRPFLDLHCVLGASDALRAGVDPFRPNDFDPYHRPHLYSTWWLQLGRLGLDRSDTLWLGGALAGALLWAGVAIAGPRDARQGRDLLLVLISPALLFSFHRANNDSVIFVVMTLGLLCFRRRGPIASLAAVGCFALATVLKVYPLLSLVVLLDAGSRRRFVGGIALFGAIVLAAWPSLLPGLRAAALYFPTPSWLYAFGAPVLLRDFEITGRIWLLPALLLGAIVAVRVWRSRDAVVSDRAPADAHAEREFFCGAVFLVGLFFLGASYVYKLVFAIWLLPWLWRAREFGGREARTARVTWGLLLGVLWFEGLVALAINLLGHPASDVVIAGRLLLATLTVHQVLTWILVGFLLHQAAGFALRRLRGPDSLAGRA